MKLLKITIAFALLVSLQIAAAQWLNVPPPVEARMTAVVAGCGVPVVEAGGAVTISNFNTGTNTNEINTLAEWTLVTDGTPITISTSSAQEGAACAEATPNDGGHSTYTAPFTQTARYYLLTFYIYIPSGQSSGNTWSPFQVYSGGTAAGNKITQSYVYWNNSTSVVLNVYGSADWQVVGLTAGAWNKIEIEFDTTDHDWRISIDDGAASAAFTFMNDLTPDRISITNEGTAAGTIRFDTITGEDGGTL